VTRGVFRLTTKPFPLLKNFFILLDNFEIETPLTHPQKISGYTPVSGTLNIIIFKIKK